MLGDIYATVGLVADTFFLPRNSVLNKVGDKEDYWGSEQFSDSKSQRW